MNELKELRNYLITDSDRDDNYSDLYVKLNRVNKDNPETIYDLCAEVAHLCIKYQDPHSQHYHVNNSYTFNNLDTFITTIESDFYNKSTKMTGNWWFWRIGIPLQYTIIKAFRPHNLYDFEDTIKKFVYKFVKNGDLTYANLASACKILYIAGVITNNKDFIETSLKYGKKAIQSKSDSQKRLARKLQTFSIKHPSLPHPTWMYAGKEGIYSDGSFIQHTSVPSTCSYGIEILQFTSLIKHMDEDYYDINYKNAMKDWIKAFQQATYDGQAMLGLSGRKAWYSNMRSTANTINKYLDQLTKPNSEPIINVLAASDTVIKEEKDWRFILNMFSDRVAPFEIVNGEGESSKYLRNGTGFFYRKGTSNYDSINLSENIYVPGNLINYNNKEKYLYKEELKQDVKQPLFNYDKKEIDHLRAGAAVNKHTYEGVVVAGMQNSTDNRSWHMFDNCIICAGKLESKNFDIIVDNRDEVPVRAKNLPEGSWVYEQSKLIYVPLSYGLSIDRRSNKHTLDYSDTANSDYRTLVLSVYSGFNYGYYAYAILPTGSEEEAASILKEIHNNLVIYNDDIHTFKYRNTWTIQAFKKGSVSANGIYFSCNQPMSAIIYLYKDSNNTYKNFAITVADYTQDYDTLEFTIRGSGLNLTKKLDMSDVKPGESKTFNVISLPTNLLIY